MLTVFKELYKGCARGIVDEDEIQVWKYIPKTWCIDIQIYIAREGGVGYGRDFVF